MVVNVKFHFCCGEKKQIMAVKTQINMHHIPCYPCKIQPFQMKSHYKYDKTKISTPFVLVVFIGQNTCLWFVCFFTQQHENLSTSITTISTKCVFYKRIIFQTVFLGQCVGLQQCRYISISNEETGCVHTDYK